MDKIFHSTFDFFTHALPGLCVVIALYFLDIKINTPQEFMLLANQISWGGGFFILLISYIIGFAIHPLGRWYYRKYGFKIWNEKVENEIEMFNSDKYAILREFSPVNFKYVETWHMFCSMSHNFAIACIIVSIISLFKIFALNPPNNYFWVIVSITSFLLSFIFTQRAIRFFIWARHDLNAALKMLQLEERAKKLIEK